MIVVCNILLFFLFIFFFLVILSFNKLMPVYVKLLHHTDLNQADCDCINIESVCIFVTVCILFCTTVSSFYGCTDISTTFSTINLYVSTVKLHNMWTDTVDQTVQIQVRLILIMVYTVCHSICLFVVVFFTEKKLFNFCDKYANHFRRCSNCLEFLW